MRNNIFIDVYRRVIFQGAPEKWWQLLKDFCKAEEQHTQLKQLFQGMMIHICIEKIGLCFTT